MNVRCESCETVYRIDPDRLPVRGIRARCTVCSHLIAIEGQVLGATADDGSGDTYAPITQDRVANALGDAFIAPPESETEREPLSGSVPSESGTDRQASARSVFATPPEPEAVPTPAPRTPAAEPTAPEAVRPPEPPVFEEQPRPTPPGRAEQPPAPAQPSRPEFRPADRAEPPATREPVEPASPRPEPQLPREDLEARTPPAQPGPALRPEPAPRETERERVTPPDPEPAPPVMPPWETAASRQSPPARVEPAPTVPERPSPAQRGPRPFDGQDRRDAGLRTEVTSAPKRPRLSRPFSMPGTSSAPAPAAGAPTARPAVPKTEPPRPSAPVFTPTPGRPVQPPPVPPRQPISVQPQPAPTRRESVPAQPPPPVSSEPTGRPVNPFLSRDPRQKARRLARALISDMIVYQPEKRQRAMRDGNLKEAFGEEIKKSWEEFVEQVGSEIANSTTHFNDALNDILAGGQKVF